MELISRYLDIPHLFGAIGQYLPAVRQFAGERQITGGYWLFLVLGLITIFLYGVSIGRTRAMVSLLSIYAAYTLTLLFPYSRYLSAHLSTNVPTFVMQAGLFFAIYCIVLFILNNSLRNRLSIGDINLWQISLISVLQVGLFVSILLDFISGEIIPQKLHPILPYVAGDTARFLWGAASIAIFPFIHGRRRAD